MIVGFRIGSHIASHDRGNSRNSLSEWNAGVSGSTAGSNSIHRYFDGSEHISKVEKDGGRV